MNQDAAKKQKMLKFRLAMLSFMLVIIIVVFALSVPAAAWYYHERRAAFTAPVELPSDIIINAANDENIVYLDLSGIDVEDTSFPMDAGGYYYRDYVFTVSGDAISYYILQLAHTTNNSFVYEIYHAKETNNEAEALVAYKSMEGDREGQTLYYKMAGFAQDRVDGAYLNPDGSLAKNGDKYYTETYSSYTNVQQNARPLYWQCSENIPANNLSGNPEKEVFHDYYILRVKWGAARVAEGNDRETDIVYVAAKMAVK